MSELPLPPQEYFAYHPPKTPERVALHARINRDMQDLFESLRSDLLSAAEKLAALETVERMVCSDRYCHDAMSKSWAMDTIFYLKDIIFNPGLRQYPEDTPFTTLMPLVQQIRMNLNQGATIDELLTVRESNSQCKSVTEN